MSRVQPASSLIQLPSLSKITQASITETQVLNETPAANTPTDERLSASIQGSANPSLSLEQEPQYITHKVKRGETLGKIAKQYLGKANLHPEIYQANRDDLRNPNDLRIGMILKIPLPAESHQVEQVDPPEPTPTETPLQPTPPPSEPAYAQHTVKRGESLSSIALRVLGDSERYMEIYQANRDLLKNPDAIHPGMSLKIPNRDGSSSVQPTQPEPNNGLASTDASSDAAAIDATGLTPGAQELLAAMQRYQQHHAARGNTNRTQTTPAQMREIARELDSASQAFGVDPKMMLALYAHESGGINPGARSHTGAGGLGQLTSIAIRQVHFMAGIGKGNRGTAPFTQYKSNFIQNNRSIRERYNIKSNVWTSVAYMSYELNDRARLGRGVENALKRYGDPSVSTYANKVNSEYKILFGGKIF